MKINRNELAEKVSKLENMPICHAWNGYGSTIYIELGKDINSLDIDAITATRNSRVRKRINMEGEAHICLVYWRIEKKLEVICGSSDSYPEMEEGIKKLIGHKIAKIDIVGEIPELLITLTNGLRILSNNQSNSDSFFWSIKQVNTKHLGFEGGELYEAFANEKGSELSEMEIKISEQADRITKRWGEPKEEPVCGLCKNCVYEIRIDGNFDLLDYSVCVNEKSIFDGRVVNRGKSGCSSFVPDESEN